VPNHVGAVFYDLHCTVSFFLSAVVGLYSECKNMQSMGNIII